MDNVFLNIMFSWIMISWTMFFLDNSVPKKLKDFIRQIGDVLCTLKYRIVVTKIYIYYFIFYENDNNIVWLFDYKKFI